jgi:hypothetical protein
MPFTVNTSDEFDSWFTPLEEALQDDILFVVRLLQEHGPQLRRPYADTLEGTSLGNLKELRVQHRGEPYRILFAFDPKREALLLIGGNKAGDKRWYKRMIPLAEAIFERHLATLEKGDGNGKTH